MADVTPEQVAATDLPNATVLPLVKAVAAKASAVEAARVVHEQAQEALARAQAAADDAEAKLEAAKQANFVEMANLVNFGRQAFPDN